MILYSCSKSGELLPEQALTLSFQISDAPVISSRSLDYTQEERIDDINLWLYNTDYNYAQHFYLQNTLQFQTELKPGEYELFAVANIGTNVGGLPRSMMGTIGSTFSSEADLTKNNRLIMAARQTVRPGAPATITLRRVVSRIDVNITVGGTTDPRTVVKFIRLCKSPATARLFTENRATPTSASTKYPDHTGYDARQTSTSFYLTENLQGTIPSITEPWNRSPQNAPAAATYLLIRTANAYYGRYMDYTVYLGRNETTDFNVPRNSILKYQINILGENTTDLRVSVAQPPY